jgi:N-acetylneuraminate lyase
MAKFKLDEFTGIIPAVVTAFDENENYDLERQKKVVDFLIELGAGGLYLTGSTGQGPYMDSDERNMVVDTITQHVAGRVPVVAHIAGVSTKNSIKMAIAAEKSGADGVSAVPSYYYTFSPEHIKQYYRDIANSTNLPLIIYAQTQRFSPTPEMVAELAETPTIQGIKYTGPTHYIMGRIKRHLGKGFRVYCGTDEMLLSGLTMGADAAIGSSYNILADLYIDVVNRFWAGKTAEAKERMLVSNDILEILQGNYDYSAALRASFEYMGVDSGYNPGPSSPLDDEMRKSLRIELTEYAKRPGTENIRLLDSLR